MVTEKDTSLIDTYAVSFWGVAGSPIVTPSNGSTRTACVRPARYLIVSDAAIGALSSYSVARNGELSVVSGSVPDGEAAPCWVAVSGTMRSRQTRMGTRSLPIRSDGGERSRWSTWSLQRRAADTDMAVAGPDGQYLLIYDAGAGESRNSLSGMAGRSLRPTASPRCPPGRGGARGILRSPAESRRGFG